MAKSRPIFYNALMLTGVNLLLRVVSTVFNVYLSRRIGAEGIGLVHLVLSVTAMATTAGIGGIRTTTMYLCAEELGRKQEPSIPWILSGCFLYSLFCSAAVASIIYFFAPDISAEWIGVSEAAPALRFFSAFLPVICLSSVMSGLFTAASRIGTLAAVEIAEQLCSMGVTLLLLQIYAGHIPSRAVIAVLFGSGAGACVTLLSLVRIRRKEKNPVGPRIPVARRILSAAVPLALADNLKACISTTENLMVPKRLALFPGTDAPLALFGMVCGMVFPVIMFPAAILFGLAELLIPEMARCSAAGSHSRIRYLVRRSLRVTLIYSLAVAGILYLLSDTLCRALYQTGASAPYLRMFSPVIPMLYCDIVTDSMVKGLGQQRICVRYNILTSAMDVAFLYFLLPKYGMNGYYFSFVVTHLLNFILSLRKLLQLTGQKITPYVPVLAVSDALAAGFLCGKIPMMPGRLIAFPMVLLALLQVTGVIRQEDFTWIKQLVTAKTPAPKGRR